MSDTLDPIVDAANEVLDGVGPGQTESTYHRALEHEFSAQGISFSSETTIPIFYKGFPVGKRRPDMIIEIDGDSYIVELKAGNSSGEEQLFDYLSILENDSNFDISGGILIRFNDRVEVVISDDE